MTRVLVTGATGFVGTAAVQALRRRGADVVAASRAQGDLLDPSVADELCRAADASHLLHLAWFVDHGRFWHDAANVDWVEATLRLVRAFASAGGRRVVLGSSAAVYAADAGRCAEGTSPTRPRTLYGAAKLATGELACAAADALGLEVADARLFQLYGPGEDIRRLVPSITTALLRDEAAPCSSGEHERDFVSVIDAGDALAAIVTGNVRGAVNVGTGEARSIAAMALAIGEHLGRRHLIDIGAIPGTDHTPLLVADVTRLATEVGWAARPFDVALDETISWWRARMPA